MTGSSDPAWRVADLVWPKSIELSLEPTARQTMALAMDWKRELLFGGAAGGGKSVFLLLAALQFVDFPEYRGLILRRTFTQLSIADGLLDLAATTLAGQANGTATIDGKPTRWKFPSGAEIHFGHAQHLKDRENYQGGAYHFVGFDELTQFLFEQYRYIAFSRQRRRIDSQIPIRVRATSNPGGSGHFWVKERFLDAGDNLDVLGARAFVSKRRSFVPSKLRDNPHLDAADYEESLDELHPHERKQLMEGDWNSRPPGSLFKRAWFTGFDSMPGRVRRRVRFWDLAATEEKPGTDPDWTVGLLYAALFEADVDYLIEDVRRERKKPGSLETWIRGIVEADGLEVVQVFEQEGGSSGKIAANALARHLDGYAVRFRRPTGSKSVRAGPAASASEHGRVGILRAGWNSQLFDELEQFDGSGQGHDDQVDAFSGAHGELAGRGGTTWDDLYPAGRGDQADEFGA